MKYLSMKHLPRTKIGFTLAEIMVVLFVLTVILAAFAPMMTTRTKTGGTSPWRYASPDTANAYFGALDNQTAMIGQSTKSSDDIDSKLIINTPDDETAAISFKKDGTNIGQLSLGSNGNIILGGNSEEVPTDCSYDTVVGYAALGNSEYGGNDCGYNTAIGSLALNKTTSGYNNTAVGYRAGAALTTGYNNTAIGYNTGDSITTGRNNTAIGYGAMQKATSAYYNTALGLNSAMALTKGYGNTALGYEALYDVTTGYNNTAIGRHACSGITTGNNVTCVGAYSGPNETGDETSTLYLGNTTTNTYNLGSLTVTGETTLSDNLTVSGSAYFSGADYVFFNGTSLTSLLASYLSDERLKNIKGENSAGLEKIKQMKTYDYTLKSDKKSTPHTGVIAQEVQKFFPEAVVTGEDGYLKIRKDALFFAVVNAIKELASHDSDKDLKIQELEKKNAELEERLLKLEEKTETLSAKTKKKK